MPSTTFPVFPRPIKKPSLAERCRKNIRCLHIIIQIEIVSQPNDGPSIIKNCWKKLKYWKLLLTYSFKSKTSGNSDLAMQSKSLTRVSELFDYLFPIKHEILRFFSKPILRRCDFFWWSATYSIESENAHNKHDISHFPLSWQHTHLIFRHFSTKLKMLQNPLVKESFTLTASAWSGEPDRRLGTCDCHTVKRPPWGNPLTAGPGGEKIHDSDTKPEAADYLVPPIAMHVKVANLQTLRSEHPLHAKIAVSMGVLVGLGGFSALGSGGAVGKNTDFWICFFFNISLTSTCWVQPICDSLNELTIFPKIKPGTKPCARSQYHMYVNSNQQIVEILNNYGEVSVLSDIGKIFRFFCLLLAPSPFVWENVD